MGSWSAENATKAYLRTLKMGKRAKEPDVTEFISAMAAGNNAQLMVVACASSASDHYSTSTTNILLALAAAAHQTGGRVVCILRQPEDLFSSSLNDVVEFVAGNAQTLLLQEYKEADFIVIDCNIENHEGVLKAIQQDKRRKQAIVLGYNALCNGSWEWTGSNAQMLPIGDGLLVTRTGGGGGGAGSCGGGGGRRSGSWVVKVDKFTGEEHVFRVRSPRGKSLGA